MSASAGQSSLAPAQPTAETGPPVRFTVRATPAQAALIRRAAAVRGISAAQLILFAAVVEAQRQGAGDQDLPRSTDGRRLDLINEVFDRLGAALGESRKSVDLLDDLIQRARCQTAITPRARTSGGGVVGPD